MNESIERADLAGYACKSSMSRGRRHAEEFRDNRPAFERDRDRIIHCAAFRRLEYKTRVFVNHEGDYYRIVEELRPDVIALGYDQKFDVAGVEAKCAARGVPCKVVRLPHFVGDLDGTRKIIEKVAERAAEQSLYRGKA